MRSDTPNTTATKLRLRDDLIALGVELPDWLYAGAYISQLRPLLRVAIEARWRSEKDAPNYQQF